MKNINFIENEEEDAFAKQLEEELEKETNIYINNFELKSEKSDEELMTMTKEEIMQAIENMTVLELSELVKAMEEKFGVSAAAPVAVAAAGAPAAGGAAEEEKSEFDEGYDMMQKSFAGLTSVLGGLQQIGLKMPESVERGIQIIQGLMSIIQGVQTVIQVFSTCSQTANTVAVTANTAAATANTATMAALITALQINTATGMIPFFAGGGVAHAARGMRVPGNYMSGD